MSKQDSNWAKSAIAILRSELPKNGVSESEVVEFFNNWKTNQSYVFPFQKKVPVAGRWDEWHKSMGKAENAAIDALNKYWTILIREELNKE